MSHCLRRRHLVALIVALLACGRAHTVSSGIAIEVSPGLAPEYRWATGAGFSLGVTRLTAPATVVWGVANPRAQLASPVQHGIAPPGAEQVSAIELRLAAGVRYRVTVTLADGRTGSREFTPANTESTR